jgi:lipopolysaccharide transport system permease protein
VYFPRLVIPSAGVLSAAPDFAIAFVVLIVMMAFYGMTPTIAVLALPAFILLAFVTALAAGLWLSALNVLYRDFRYVLPFVTQFWLFLTPIAYPSTLLQEPWRSVYGLNPMVGVVEGFRWALLGGRECPPGSEVVERCLTTGPPGPIVALSAVAAVGLLIGGAYFFRRIERTFADVV